VLDLVVGGVERDVPGGAAESASRPGQHRVSGAGEAARLAGDVVLAAAEAVRQQDRRCPVASGGFVERRVERDVRVVSGAAGHGDALLGGADGRFAVRGGAARRGSGGEVKGRGGGGPGRGASGPAPSRPERARDPYGETLYAARTAVPVSGGAGRARR